MENLDKDIELVSNMKNIELKGKVNEQYIYAKIPEEYLNAIENVLADRKMWKKIAEKLAEDKIIPKCKNCSDEDTHECTECALDWARKEVEKDECKIKS